MQNPCSHSEQVQIPPVEWYFLSYLSPFKDAPEPQFQEAHESCW